MKYFVCTTLFVIMAFLLQAQPGKDTLYGFQQHVSPGIKSAGDIDENGKLLKKESPDMKHYTIYLSTASKARVYPIQLWINGRAFSVEVDTLAHPPYVYTNTDAPATKSKPLFPKTSGTIYKLNPIPLIADKSSSKAKALVKANAVVFYYIRSGIKHYGVLKKFTELEPVSLQ